jgi:hypothetical protein
MAGYGLDNTPAGELLGGGQIASRSRDGSQLPNIGSTMDASVAEDVPGPTDANGYPITPAAARRYSPAAAQSYRHSSVDPGAP